LTLCILIDRSHHCLIDGDPRKQRVTKTYASSSLSARLKIKPHTLYPGDI
jgi:hypothetical protein